MNVCSLFDNFSEFRNTIVDHDFDLVGVTETWLRAAEAFSFDIDGYNFVHNDRATRGGGTGIYVRRDLRYCVVSFNLNLENTSLLLELGGN